eukprot:TRINITY_DN12509_c0_g1_i2.p1 TRINITY_DN12509_c0_g1~~TRINITY_DN12509_c0_g1_i2.p1  ORF type:complete len:612 (-),score=102.35 TRINITY_DN12509_c0_g1_i2:142-1941(-)
MPTPSILSADCPVVAAPGEKLAEVLDALQHVTVQHGISTEDVKALEIQQKKSEKGMLKLHQQMQHMGSALNGLTERVEGMLHQFNFDLEEESTAPQIRANTLKENGSAKSRSQTPLSNNSGESLATGPSGSRWSMEPEGINGDEVYPNHESQSVIHSIDKFKPAVLKRSIIDEIMKTDDEPLPPVSSGMRPYVSALSRRIVKKRCFEYTVCMVIAVNSIILGVETELSLSHPEYSLLWAEYLETGFLCIYLLEIFLRLAAEGKQCFYDGWFLFDFCLIISSAVGLVLSPFSNHQDNSSESDVWQQVMILRTFRMLRLIRALRMIKQLRSIWRLVYGLITCCSTIISTLTLLVLVTYVFSVLGLEFISKDGTLIADPVTAQIIEMQFSSLGVTMMTLMQFVTLDSAAAFYAPLIKVKPLLAIYFAALVVVVSISLMNLVTAVLVEGALEHARQDREEESRLLNASVRTAVPQIVSIFDRIDVDGSGTIALDEIAHLPLHIIPSKLLDKASVESMKELFEMLDVDCTGELTREEFTEGLLNIFLLDVPLCQMQQIRMLRLLRREVSIVQGALGLAENDGERYFRSSSKERDFSEDRVEVKL